MHHSSIPQTITFSSWSLCQTTYCKGPNSGHLCEQRRFLFL